MRNDERNPPSHNKAIPWVSVGCARRDERVSFQRPLRERNPNKWVKLRSSMS